MDGQLKIYDSNIHIGRDQGGAYWGTFYELVGTELKYKLSYMSSGPDGDYRFEINDVVVNEDDFYAALAPYIDMNWVNIGTKYELTKDGINSAF